MTMNEFFEALAQISGLLFVVTSMLAMGLSLTVPQIMQPLRNMRLVMLAARVQLASHFFHMPAISSPITGSLSIALPAATFARCLRPWTWDAPRPVLPNELQSK